MARSELPLRAVRANVRYSGVFARLQSGIDFFAARLSPLIAIGLMTALQAGELADRRLNDRLALITIDVGLFRRGNAPE